MKTYLLTFVRAIPKSFCAVLAILVASESHANMVTVSGNLQISRHEVTQSLWSQVRTWALANGYQISAGSAASPNHPIANISWYDAAKWCNAKSEMEGLTPVYINRVGGFFNVFRSGDYGDTFGNAQKILPERASSGGYRLPTEAEWELAAKGGALGKGFKYSGSNDINSVAWYAANSGGSSKAVGSKAANELGIFDMTGNVMEWTEGFLEVPAGVNRVVYRRGRGGWFSATSLPGLQVNIPGTQQPSKGSNLTGFRFVRNVVTPTPTPTPRPTATPTPRPTATPTPRPTATPTPKPSPTPSLAPVINSSLNVKATVNSYFIYRITAKPYKHNAKFSVSGKLPSGLTFRENGNDPQISGWVEVKNKNGIYPVTLSATNQHGTGTATLQIEVVRK